MNCTASPALATALVSERAGGHCPMPFAYGPPDARQFGLGKLAVSPDTAEMVCGPSQFVATASASPNSIWLPTVRPQAKTEQFITLVEPSFVIEIIVAALKTGTVSTMKFPGAVPTGPG